MGISTNNIQTLHLRWTERKIQLRGNQIERKYLDYVVDNQSLKDLLGSPDADLVSAFGWNENKAYVKEILQQYRLKRPSDLETGRIMLYVCPECGDIGCGAITCFITDLGDRIQWSEFGYEGSMGEVDLYGFPAFQFDRQQYFNTLLEAQKTIP